MLHKQYLMRATATAKSFLKTVTLLDNYATRMPWNSASKYNNSIATEASVHCCSDLRSLMIAAVQEVSRHCRGAPQGFLLALLVAWTAPAHEAGPA